MRAQRQERIWWALQDLNLGPIDYESTALTAELRALFVTGTCNRGLQRKIIVEENLDARNYVPKDLRV